MLEKIGLFFYDVVQILYALGMFHVLLLTFFLALATATLTRVKRNPVFWLLVVYCGLWSVVLLLAIIYGG